MGLSAYLQQHGLDELGLRSHISVGIGMRSEIDFDSRLSGSGVGVLLEMVTERQVSAEGPSTKDRRV